MEWVAESCVACAVGVCQAGTASQLLLGVALHQHSNIPATSNCQHGHRPPGSCCLGGTTSVLLHYCHRCAVLPGSDGFIVQVATAALGRCWRLNEWRRSEHSRGNCGRLSFVVVTRKLVVPTVACVVSLALLAVVPVFLDDQRCHSPGFPPSYSPEDPRYTTHHNCKTWSATLSCPPCDRARTQAQFHVPWLKPEHKHDTVTSPDTTSPSS